LSSSVEQSSQGERKSVSLTKVEKPTSGTAHKTAPSSSSMGTAEMHSSKTTADVRALINRTGANGTLSLTGKVDAPSIGKHDIPSKLKLTIPSPKVRHSIHLKSITIAFYGLT